jgi:uncharacterized protein
MKVFLDANILFSAARPESPLRAMVVALVRRSACVTNSHAIVEAERNLVCKRPEHVDSFHELLARIPVENRFSDPVEVILADKDKPILGGAIGCQCTHLLTGDRTHFGRFYGQTVHGVLIVPPRLLANELIELGWAKPEVEPN